MMRSMCFVANKNIRICAHQIFCSHKRGVVRTTCQILYIASILHAHHLQSYKKIKVHMHGTFRNSSSHLALKVMAFCTDTHTHTHTHTYTHTHITTVTPTTRPRMQPPTHACTLIQTDRLIEREIDMHSRIHNSTHRDLPHSQVCNPFIRATYTCV